MQPNKKAERKCCQPNVITQMIFPTKLDREPVQCALGYSLMKLKQTGKKDKESLCGKFLESYWGRALGKADYYFLHLTLTVEQQINKGEKR